VLKREVVRANAEDMISSAIARHDLIRVGTTGTTGAALGVAYDDETARRVWAMFLRQWIWAGLRTNEPRVTFFGSRVVPSARRRPPYWVHNLCERQMLASSFHLSARTAPDYLKFLARHRGQVLEAFPSVLGILADFVLEQGITIPMKTVFTSGEPLYPFLREKAEKAFSTRVFDTYGMTELCGIIQECEHGRMHLAPESAYLEILDDDNEPVRPGEDGYLTWTGFLNFAMPLIRYRIGDRGNWDLRDACPCGRNFPMVVPTITRDSDLLHCPDGRIFSPRTLNQTLKQAFSFRFCQFVHDGHDRLLVRAVSSSPQAAKSDLDQVCANVRRLLGPGMDVAGSLEIEPIMRAGGKMPLIVRQPATSSMERV
jgi:phenylacetate-CoA ligase